MKTAIVLVITMALAAGPLYGADNEQPPPTPAQEQPEVLTRGPVHEAFAEPVDLNTQPGYVAPAQPPANIAETPPAERPTGERFVWVPGYWAWDSERNSYIWVSGCWRAAPPNMYWVPGYWVKVAGGWQWIAGFWTPVAGAGQIEYLPAPPAIDDVQPPGAPPSSDNIWVPPCWYWYQGQYIRRPGYWLVAQADWLWAPSHYVWTPRGYVFVAGQWDYPLERRGVLFAPYYIPRHVYERPGFFLSLGAVVNIGNLQLGLFTCPRYNHFYFGDYYDDIYIGIGIYPWFECERRHTWYDPIYQHDRWSHRRTEPGWEEHQRREYDIRRTDRGLRPPRTYHEMETRQAKLPESQRGSIQMARPMSAVVADKSSPMKFEQIKADARQKLSREVTDVRKFGDERSRWESNRGQKIKDKGQRTDERGQTIRPPSTETANRVQKTDESGQKTSPRPPSTVTRPQNEPDRVKIPSSPIADRQGVLGIFRKGPPSRPADEQKADVKNTPRGQGASRDRDTSRGSDSPRNRDQRGGERK